jgi:hypothetical protein
MMARRDQAGGLSEKKSGKSSTESSLSEKRGSKDYRISLAGGGYSYKRPVFA